MYICIIKVSHKTCHGNFLNLTSTLPPPRIQNVEDTTGIYLTCEKITDAKVYKGNMKGCLMQIFSSEIIHYESVPHFCIFSIMCKVRRP